MHGPKACVAEIGLTFKVHFWCSQCKVLNAKCLTHCTLQKMFGDKKKWKAGMNKKSLKINMEC